MRLVLPVLLLVGVAAAQESSTTRLLGQESYVGRSESTEMFFPQISHRVKVVPNLPENPLRPPRRDPGGPNGLPVGGLLNEERGRTLARFPGITYTGWRPPDPTAAAGPTHAVATVNSSIAFFTRAGVKTFEGDLETFFASLSPGSFVFDPKVFYDWHAGRFVVCVLEEDDGTVTSRVLLAVSDDSDPTGTWHKYAIDVKTTVGGSDCWGDYPGFGYNKDGYVIALNLFTFSGGAFEGVEIVTVKKSSVINGGTATVTKFINTDADSFSLQCAETLDPAATKLFMVNAASTTKLKVWTLSSLGGTPPAPTTQLVTVPSYVEPDGSGLASTSSHLLDDLDGRLINVMYTDGKLVTAHTVKATGDDRRRVRWYELTLPPTGGVATLAQSGEVKESTGAEKHYHMGAIGRAPTGDIAIIMSRSGPSGPVADIVRAMRRSTDAAGTMGAPTLIKAAEGATYGFSGYNRWGDYAACSVDPLNERLFWGIHMTGTSSTTWTTEISTFSLSTTTTPTVSAIAFSAALYGGGSSIVGTLTTSAAPTVDTAVALSSSDTTAATVPASVTVLSGTTSKTFLITPTSSGLDTAKTTVITAVMNGVAFAKALTVNPAILSSFTTAATSINATATTVGTLTLTGKAGPSGSVVTVVSSKPAAAYPISGSITVASGLTIRNFTIYTNLVTVDTAVMFTATLGATKTKWITVVSPPALTTFTVSPTVVTGGTSATVTATLAGPTAVAGLKVSLSDSSAFASMPATATFALGASSTTATVTTTTPPSARLVTLTAKFNGVTKTATLAINP